MANNPQQKVFEDPLHEKGFLPARSSALLLYMVTSSSALQTRGLKGPARANLLDYGT